MSRRIRIRRPRPLPFVESAWIPDDKLKLYVLNPDHEQGRHKAAAFESQLSITQADWQYLRDEILRELPNQPTRTWSLKQWRDGGTVRFGLEYEVHVPVSGREGQRCQVLTGWLVDGRSPPRLTTTWPIG